MDSSVDLKKDYEMVSDWQIVKGIQEAVHKETQIEKEKNASAARKRNDNENTGENDVIVEEIDDSNIDESQNKELKKTMEQICRPSPNAAQKRSFKTAFANHENTVMESISDGSNKKSKNVHDDNDDLNNALVVEIASKKAKPSDNTDKADYNRDSCNSDVNSNSINDASDVISDLDENLKATEGKNMSTRSISKLVN